MAPTDDDETLPSGVTPARPPQRVVAPPAAHENNVRGVAHVVRPPQGVKPSVAFDDTVLSLDHLAGPPQGATPSAAFDETVLRVEQFARPPQGVVVEEQAVPDRQKLPKGSRVGAYVVDHVLDRGGFSCIYRVTHTELGTAAAAKVLHAHLAAQPDVVLRFEREIETIQRLRHPNIVDVFEQGRLDDGRPYFIMELLSGVSLEQYQSSRSRLPPDDVAAILEMLCDALGVAHAHSIVHRDIKPSNVFLCDPEGRRRVVLLDFGVAKLLDAPGPALTMSRQVLGTITGIAPEQLLGKPVDPRTDVYGLGALTYRLLVGEPPFSGHSGSFLRQMHLHVSPPRLSARARVNPVFDDVILRAMSKDPAARQPTVAAFLAEFQAAFEASLGSRAPRQGVRARQALAVYAEVQTDLGDDDAPDDRLLADIEAILPFIASELTQAGLSVVIETGSSLIATMNLGGDPKGDEEARLNALGAALAIHGRLAGRAGRDPRVHVRLCVHLGEVVGSAEGALMGGGLLEIATWVPDRADDGVFASPEVLAGLRLAKTPVPLPLQPGEQARAVALLRVSSTPVA